MRFQILGLLSFMAVSNSLAVNDPHLNDQYHEVLSLNSNVKRQNSDDGNDDDDATTSAQIFTSRLVPSQLLPPVKTSVLLSSPLPNQIPSNVNSPIAATSNLNVPLNPTPNLSTPGVQPINSSLPPVVQPTFQPSPQITPSSQVVNTNAVPFSSAPSLYTPIGNTLSSSENSYFNSPTPVYSSNVVYPTSVISANPSSDRSESILPLPGASTGFSNSFLPSATLASISRVSGVETPLAPSVYPAPYPTAINPASNSNGTVTAANGDGKSNSGAIAGGVIGSIAFIALLAGLVLYRRRRNKRKNTDIAPLSVNNDEPSSGGGFFSRFGNNMNMPAFTRMNNQSSDLDGNGNPADTASGRPNMSTNMSYQPNRFDSMATFPAAARIQDIREEPRENEAMRIKPDPIMHNQEAHFIDSIRSAKPLPTPNREQPNTNTTTTVLPNFQNEPINITNPTYHKPLNHALDISQNSVNNSENVVTSSMAPLSTIHRPTPAVPLKDETNLSSAITPRDNGIPVNNERSKPYSPASKLTETPKSFNERGNEKPPYNVSRKIGSEEVYPEMITNTPSDKISSRGSNVTSPKFDIANMPGLVNTMKNRSTNQDMNDLKPPKNNISHHENLSKSSVLSNASGMSEGGILGEPLEETVIVGFNQSQSTLSSHASDGPVVQHTLNSKDPFDSRLVMTAVSSYMPQRPNEIMVLPDDKLLISEEVGEEWLVGYNNSRNPGVKGYFPRGCVVGGYFN